MMIFDLWLTIYDLRLINYWLCNIDDLWLMIYEWLLVIDDVDWWLMSGNVLSGDWWLPLVIDDQWVVIDDWLVVIIMISDWWFTIYDYISNWCWCLIGRYQQFGKHPCLCSLNQQDSKFALLESANFLCGSQQQIRAWYYALLNALIKWGPPGQYFHHLITHCKYLITQSY